jgi:gas vesicle protein
MNVENDDLLFLAGLFLGAIAGSLAAVLLTPRSGPETREQVVERGLELKGRAEDAVQRAQNVASDTVAKVQSAAQGLVGQKPGDDIAGSGGGI